MEPTFLLLFDRGNKLVQWGNLRGALCTPNDGILPREVTDFERMGAALRTLQQFIFVSTHPGMGPSNRVLKPSSAGTSSAYG
jgi:hypothetical protein